MNAEVNFVDKSVPAFFRLSNQAKKGRSAKLAEMATQWFLKQNLQTNEVGFLKKTQELDEDGIGISHSTLYKNKKVSEFFSQVSASVIQRKKRAKEGRNGRPNKPIGKQSSQSKRGQDTNLRNTHNGKSKIQLMRELDEQKKQKVVLEEQNSILLREQKELKEQLLKQLIQLTKLEFKTSVD